MWLLDRALRRVLKQGELTIIDHDGRRHAYGAPAAGLKPVTIRFSDAKVAGAIARNPQLGAGEAWMDGRLQMLESDLLDLIRLMRRNNRFEDIGPREKWRGRGGRLRARIDRMNWPARSRRNVAHHYDLGNAFYRLFLDDDLQYSCAYFTDPANSLEQAQADKKAHIAAKLALEPGMRVLDIGCGWGGMALYLHRVADVDVLGITLSTEQLRLARERAEAAGVAHRVRFELMDYRGLTGTFDRIVSVGMFEHVGPPHYNSFFAKARSLLEPDGVMLLHTIGRFGAPGVTDRFTSKYIFPGGYIPALSEIVAASERQRLILSDVETLRLHYAYTILHWYRRSQAQAEAIVRMYDERFYRMWLFYLAGAATVFEDGGMGNYQLQYVRDRRALPITRDYLVRSDAAYGRGTGAEALRA